MGYYEIAGLVADLVTSTILSTLTKSAMYTSLTFLRSLLNALEIKKTAESRTVFGCLIGHTGGTGGLMRLPKLSHLGLSIQLAGYPLHVCNRHNSLSR